MPTLLPLSHHRSHDAVGQNRRRGALTRSRAVTRSWALQRTPAIGVVAALTVAALAAASTPAGAAITPASAAVTPASAAITPAGGFDPDDYAFRQVNLVSDQPGKAALTDKNLVNAWGLSQGPSTPVWVSDNGTDVTTLYTGGAAGHQPAIVPLVVRLPGGAPTGQVFNPTTGFVLSNRQQALFIFAGEDGDISAWNQTLSPITEAEHVASIPGGVFKGMALLQGRSGNRLLVADFAHGRIAAFDGRFHRVALPPKAFWDPQLPTGYAPFNVAVLGGRVVVAYTVRNPRTNDDVAGAGHGIIDVYSAGGRLLRHLVRHGVLNSPWGLAMAPAGFGAFAGDLLVGNFGDGRIHAFDPRTGHLDGTLRDRHGHAIVIDGLWGLLPGNGTSAGTADVWFSAGPGGEAHGLLGVLRPAGE